MAAFATVQELADHLQTTIAVGQPTTSAQAALDAASAAIRSYTRQTISGIDDDVVTLDGNQAEVLFLPELPVTDVSSVTAASVTLVVGTDYVWYPEGTLYRTTSPLSPPSYRYLWPNGRANVVVTYDHGYAEIPADVKDVAMALSARAMANPTFTESESIGNYSIQYLPRSLPHMYLSDDEKARLDPYRLVSVA